jgi:hypothetical protein
MALSCPSFQLFDTLHQEMVATPDLRALRDEAAVGMKLWARLEALGGGYRTT